MQWRHCDRLWEISVPFIFFKVHSRKCCVSLRPYFIFRKNLVMSCNLEVGTVYVVLVQHRFHQRISSSFKSCPNETSLLPSHKMFTTFVQFLLRKCFHYASILPMSPENAVMLWWYSSSSFTVFVKPKLLCLSIVCFDRANEVKLIK